MTLDKQKEKRDLDLLKQLYKGETLEAPELERLAKVLYFLQRDLEVMLK